jgi:ribonucleoside-diphosphate reductase alpha chain
MRVALGIWGDNLTQVQKTYDMLSTSQFTHATPTLFNAGTKRPQLSSCFLIGNKGDNIEALFETISDVAKISKWSGGIGLHIHDVRAKGSYIKGTGGYSDGIVPMLKTYNETARWINQGGRRKGSFAIYLEPWHADVFDFIELRKNSGKEEMRARDLFLALWVPDLFMERVEEDGNWTLMCPNECPGLSDVYDTKDTKEFTKLYSKYENENRGRKTIKARDLWAKILEAQIEGGTPYILYKDAANYKSNQQNIGTIKSSNLCAEILEVSTPKEQAVCNLASLGLPKMVILDKKNKSFDHQKLYDITYQVTHNLNRVIDVNYYPTKETKVSNLRHRPIGIGVQGLADTFALLGLAFESDEAKKLNKEIHETMYFAALSASKDIAKSVRKELIEKNKDTEIDTTAGAYETFNGSPASKGILQFDMWETTENELSGRWDWEKLKKDIIKYGIRNSLLMCSMPTASTSQILGNNECIEPYTSNIYKRNTLSGEYIIVNKHLIKDLINLNLWNDKMRIKIIENNGSIQNIEEIPNNLKEIYKTVWEMKLSNLIDMSRDRGLFICQTQSFNIFMPDVNVAKLNKALFYAWKKGLKTGMYYLRSQAKAEARKSLGIDVTTSEPIVIQNSESDLACSLDNPENCISCSS